MAADVHAAVDFPLNSAIRTGGDDRIVEIADVDFSGMVRGDSFEVDQVFEVETIRSRVIYKLRAIRILAGVNLQIRQINK